jgi:5'-3' exonuclease
LDCNSIIYDAVRSLDFDEIETRKNAAVIDAVIEKIDEYIALIGPRNTVMIAFDGVAPVAKLDQQRNRRHKSCFQNEVNKSIFNSTASDPWNTTAITPGTEFMKELNDKVHSYYGAETSSSLQVIVSTSDVFGEGEHKIFDYIRQHPKEHSETTTVIYGLDADLIMLSINHLPISPKIYLFRETPEFIKSIDNSLEPNETYVLDIPELARIITTDMNNGTTRDHSNRVYDYIFLCFFLGNDFMPHFPAVNIRTGGIDKMLNAYKATIGGTRENLTDGKTIFWKNVRKMVAALAENEEDFFRTETKERDRNEKRVYPTRTPAEKFRKFDAVPTYDRDVEKYINPFANGWQARYYDSFFDIPMNTGDELKLKAICLNYLEGLEWTMKYYTEGCPDWRWCYKYQYPPLLEDLIRYIPYFDETLVPVKCPQPVTPLVQLCYVMPFQSLQFLPRQLELALKKKHPEWYPTDFEFTWAYCRYFWEAHVELPELDIDELAAFIDENGPF